MKYLITLLAAAVLAVVAVPAGARAATCAGHATQADAQRAADTRDADGDGIYCESLPCPCLKPGDSSGGGGASSSPPRRKRRAAPKVTCGKERWNVKTLQDDGAARVDYTPRPSTVTALRALEAPDIATHTPRQAGEFTTYRIRARLRSFKLEDDSDIHLVIGAPNDPSKTMIVEFPNSGCLKKTGPKNRRRIAAARGALVRACGQPTAGHFTLLTGTATITGVAFFDVIHGQRGVAPNGIELHPVTKFTGTCRAK